MKRLSLREVVLLCSPLLLIGVAGFVVSRHSIFPPDKPGFEFQVEKPTTLEAFRGIQAALVVRLKGPHPPQGSMGLEPFFELQTANGVQVFSSWSNAQLLKGFLKGTPSVEDSTRFLVNLNSVPSGTLHFEAKAFTASRTTGKSVFYLNEKWLIHREQIKPVVFANVPHPPLVVLRSIKVTRLFSGSVSGECTFDLSGAMVNAQTPAEIDFSGTFNCYGSNGSLGWGGGLTVPPNPKQRVWEWTMDVPAITNAKITARAAGRISIDSHWPLAFESEAFDIGKTKAGQQLKFKSWPVPVPRPTP